MGVVLSGGKAVRTAPGAYVRLSEVVTTAQRQLEDLNYTNLSHDERDTALDEPYAVRMELVKRNRMYRRKHPLAKQAFRLLAHYVLGQGVTVKANNQAMVAPIIDEFLEDPVNRKTLTSHAALTEAIDVMFTDGDLFLTVYPDPQTGKVALGTLDSLLVEDVICDPKNWRIPLWYKVRKESKKFDFASGEWVLDESVSGQNEYMYYRDWKYDDDTKQRISKEGRRIKPPRKQVEKGLVFHIARDKRGKFGESEMTAALDWLKAHKTFMEDRATVNHAAAQVAWKQKRMGPASNVAKEVNQLQSTLTSRLSAWEGNPTKTSGSTVVENEGVSMEWMNTNTGGGAAGSDERILRMMVGSALGVMNHYFGDEAAANLATATAMELPMLKNYQAWQVRLQDVHQELFDFVLSTAHEAGRIGPRDDSHRYSDRTTQAGKMMDTDSVDTEMTEGPFDAMDAALGGGSGAGVDANKLGANQAGAAFTSQREPNPEYVALANDTQGGIDWYVDIDFPPIISKDLSSFVNAMKTMYELLPQMNLESQKFVAEMILNELGVNDVQEIMDRLFDEETETLAQEQVDANTEMERAKTDAAIAGAETAKKVAEKGPPPFPNELEAQKGGKKKLKESGVSERTQRTLRVLEAASDELTEAAASS